MARIRTIKPEFWQHEELSFLHADSHILAAALLNYADDEGYFNASPLKIKGACVPLREQSMSIHGSLLELSRVGFIKLGSDKDGKRYGCIINFLSHQVISHATRSRIKDLEIKWDENSSSTPVVLQESSVLNGREWKGIEGKEEKTKAKKKKSSERFQEFKNLWPHGFWKNGKVAQDVWANKNLDAIADTILADVAKRAAEDIGWIDGYVPLPTTYLRGARWNDEIRRERPKINGPAFTNTNRTLAEIRAEHEAKQRREANTSSHQPEHFDNGNQGEELD